MKIRALIAGVLVTAGALSAQAATPLSDIAETSTGGMHSCARTTSGAAWCWGGGTYGQLGDGTASSYPAPVAVEGLSTGVTGIAAGGFHSCALTSAGGVKCWGNNELGQLGDGTTVNRLEPVDVAGLTSGVVAISAGWRHTCVVMADGSARCWGVNDAGQLGDGTTINRSQPVAVGGAGTLGVTRISAGAAHTCAIRGGGAFCWGSNGAGQLGDASFIQRTTPVAVSGLGSGVASISAASSHTCAMTTGGAATCWGSNNNAKLGIGISGDHTSLYPTPQSVVGLSTGVTSVSAGGEYACASLVGGTAKCWGINMGQLGTGSPLYTVHNTPGDVIGLDVAVVSIMASISFNSFTCALANDSRVRCWGENSHGQLGRGSLSGINQAPDNTVPRLVEVFAAPPLENVAALSTSGRGAHSCAVVSAGGIRCWGANQWGQLGDGTAFNRPGPVEVEGIGSGAIAVAAGTVHTCAAMSNGGVKCWGRNDVGQLGDGTNIDRATPVDVPGISGATAVWAREGTSCAIVTGGAVKCWGRPIGGLTEFAGPVIGGALGQIHACVVMSNGGLKCWGYNGYGQLGDGTMTDRTQPVDVVGLSSGVASVHAGDLFTCALLLDGSVRCWGMDNQGQVGTGAPSGPPGGISRPLPQTPVGLSSGVSSLGLGSATACAVQAGTVKCWGSGALGQGDFFAGDTATPTEVPYVISTPTSVFVGQGYQCITTPDLRARCWGYGGSGQLGRGYLSLYLEHSRWVALAGSAPQTLTFPPIPDRDRSDSPFTVSASASSGLPVSISAISTSVCTVSGTSVTLLNNGTCTLIARQGGNLEYLAVQETRSFAVTGSLPVPGRLANISSRALVQTGDNVVIAGFIIQGQSKKVVVRVRGPSLTAQGVAGVLANPTLQLVRIGGPATVVATNDNWQQAPNAAEIQASGFAPTDAAESAALLTLAPGGYTAVVSGVGNGTGVAIVEVFELDVQSVPLVNLSTRSQVLTGDDVLIGGFVVHGSTPLKVVVRARGPSLAAQGVAGALANPTLQLFSGPTQIATNDDWQTDGNAGQLGQYAPSDSHESAILVTLSPGAYTAIVSGVGGTTGVGIVEVFAVP